MNRTLARWLLRAYPPAWRARYGEEFEDLLHAGPGGPGTVLDILLSAARERCSPQLEGGVLMNGSPGSVLALSKRPSAFVPMAMSLAALTAVLIDVGRFGIPSPHADEGAVAHLWQLLMACQVPVIAGFAFRWLRRAPRPAFGVLAIQAALILAALAPVYLLGL